MTPAQWWVIWIGTNEVIAGLLYLYQGQHYLAVAWIAYGVACVGLAMGSK